MRTFLVLILLLVVTGCGTPIRDSISLPLEPKIVYMTNWSTNISQSYITNAGITTNYATNIIINHVYWDIKQDYKTFK
jgi:hypothetical protein